MNQNPYQNQGLTPPVAQPSEPVAEDGDLVQVTGVLTFSRLASWVEGEELTRRNEGATYKDEYPYTTAVLSDAQVIPIDPNNIRPVEHLANNRIRLAKNGKHAGRLMFYARKTLFPGTEATLPPVMARITPTEVKQIDMHSDLAIDQRVTLIMRHFVSRRPGAKPSLTIDTVIVESAEPKYYERADTAEELASLGLTVQGDITPRMSDPNAVAFQTEEEVETQKLEQGFQPAQQPAQQQSAAQQQPQQSQAPAQQAPAQPGQQQSAFTDTPQQQTQPTMPGWAMSAQEAQSKGLTAQDPWQVGSND